MLPAVNRIRKTDEFTKVFREGKKSGNALFVVYAVRNQSNVQADPTKVGFVVGKTVGNSVIRHAVIRKLRHIMRDLIPELESSRIVIRAFRPAADVTSAELEKKLRNTFIRLNLFQNKTAENNKFSQEKKEK